MHPETLRSLYLFFLNLHSEIFHNRNVVVGVDLFFWVSICLSSTNLVMHLHENWCHLLSSALFLSIFDFIMPEFSTSRIDNVSADNNDGSVSFSDICVKSRKRQSFPKTLFQFTDEQYKMTLLSALKSSPIESKNVLIFVNEKILDISDEFSNQLQSLLPRINSLLLTYKSLSETRNQIVSIGSIPTVSLFIVLNGLSNL
jgi:hypothetical protein